MFLLIRDSGAKVREMIQTQWLFAWIISTLDEVKGRMDSEARVHMNCYEWNKLRLQMICVTKAESLTAAHVFPWKSQTC